ncbi:unnamed protein product [Adineta ricciae]|uniref:F-box domain-containing protein n=1 Tax=Adineta ricciae TaxID=249248 RepID=A0A814NFE8_ADIRI|nr:unnamed protein product [Adineta ricciae]CAF1412549.1 unnamed protein product [Adineta ricciae]
MATLPPELWQQIFLFLPSLEDLAQTSAVCRLFRNLILKEWFLKEYSTRQRLRFMDNLQIWFKFTERNNLYKNFVSADQTIRSRSAETCPEVQNVFYTDKDFFYHLPCLRHNNSRISVHYELAANDFAQWTFSFWLIMCSSDHLKKLSMEFSFENHTTLQLELDFHTGSIVITNTIEKFIEQDCTQLELDKWIHFTLVLECKVNENIEVFLDGNRVLDYPCRDSPLPRHSLRRWNFRSWCYFGYLADFCLWAKKLANYEIRAIAEQKTSIDLVDTTKSVFGHTIQ